ncbi:hypothetical protein MGU_04496 [Metarhizium guizhouense ARSEF 977]|uniref:Uncharacterized protein n=1 Tax=Metarhizium guizhouense (strain ARSEF 977) TaxID=1276136 RepID=A0A0B4HFF7_METGA|nr:hypothetical protein MGU_04496 [Metarhizium guizhouense ARSEF 977]
MSSATTAVTALRTPGVPLAKDALLATAPITARLAADVDGAEPSRGGPLVAATDLAAVKGAVFRQATVLQRPARARALVYRAPPLTGALVAGGVSGMILRRLGDDDTRVSGAVAVCASLGLATVRLAVLQVLFALADPCVLASRLYAGVCDAGRLSVFGLVSPARGLGSALGRRILRIGYLHARQHFEHKHVLKIENSRGTIVHAPTRVLLAVQRLDDAAVLDLENP